MRNTSTSSSIPAQILDTVDFDTPDSQPSARTRSSTFRVEVPVTYAAMSTPHNALSTRRRGSSSDGKNDPTRTFGMRSSMSPAGVDNNRDPAVDAANLAPLRPHDLRHTAVALWIAAGASPKEIATRAGHTSIVTVLDRYGHLLPGHEDKVNDALDAMASDARTTLRIVRDDAPIAEIARGTRGMNPAEGDASQPEIPADQGKRSGRWQTRTADLCRVNDPDADADGHERTETASQDGNPDDHEPPRT